MGLFYCSYDLLQNIKLTAVGLTGAFHSLLKFDKKQKDLKNENCIKQVLEELKRTQKYEACSEIIKTMNRHFVTKTQHHSKQPT